MACEAVFVLMRHEVFLSQLLANMHDYGEAGSKPIILLAVYFDGRREGFGLVNGRAKKVIDQVTQL